MLFSQKSANYFGLCCSSPGRCPASGAGGLPGGAGSSSRTEVGQESAWALEARTGDTGGLEDTFLPLWGENLCGQSLKFRLGSTVKDNKKGFLKYVHSGRRRIRAGDIGLLLDE